MSRYTRQPNDCKVYIGDLQKDASEKEIEKAFECCGRLNSVWVARNPPGFAFVEFNDRRDAEDAVRELDGTVISGSRVRVELSSGKSRPRQWSRGGGRGPPRGRRAFNPHDKCYECGGEGHYAYDCTKNRRGGRSRRRSRSRSRSDSRSRSRGRRGSYSRSRSRQPRSRSRSVSRHSN